MKRNIVSITAIVIGTVVLTLLLTKSCTPEPTVLDGKLEELEAERVSIITTHTEATSQYVQEIGILEDRVIELQLAANSTTVEYVTVYKAHKADPTDSVIITEVVEVCNDLVVEQATVIEVQEAVIIKHEDFIGKQSLAIVALDTLVLDSHIALEEANIKITKTTKKLKRTRRIGLGGFILGIIGGIILTVSL